MLGTFALAAVTILVLIVVAVDVRGPKSAPGLTQTWGELTAVPEPQKTKRAAPEVAFEDGTDEVDPLITGQHYSGARAAGAGRRAIYGAQKSYGDAWGMREFSTNAAAPVALRAPDDEDLDDGIPEVMRLSTERVRQGPPSDTDYYDVYSRGPATRAGIVSIQEPDHDVLTN
jgi:hypothetical protein